MKTSIILMIISNIFLQYMCCEVLLLSVSNAVSLHAVPQHQYAIQETIKKNQPNKKVTNN